MQDEAEAMSCRHEFELIWWDSGDHVRRACPETAEKRNHMSLKVSRRPSLSTGFWTGNSDVMVDHSVHVYLTAHNGGIKGCEDVRPEQLIAATL